MKKLLGLILIIGILGGGYFYYNKSKVSSAPKEYETIKVEKSKFEKVVEVSGVIQARDTKLMYVDRNLKVDKVFFSAGDYVKKGTVIMTFDPEDKNKVLRNIKKEKLNLKKQERDLKHAKSMFEVGGSSQVAISDLELEVEKTKLNIEGLEEELSKMIDEIKSPFDGTIISMVAEENYRVNTEVELFEVADLSNLVVMADVPEYSINGVKVGQMAKIRPDAYNGELTGKVGKISTLSSATLSASTSSSNQSSTSTSSEAYVEVEVTIDELPKELRPGFNTTLDIVVSSLDDVITVPRYSILEDKEGYFLFILSDDKEIMKKYVRIADSNSDSVVINNMKDGVNILKNPYLAMKSSKGTTNSGGTPGEGGGTGQGGGNGQGGGKKNAENGGGA